MSRSRFATAAPSKIREGWLPVSAMITAGLALLFLAYITDRMNALPDASAPRAIEQQKTIDIRLPAIARARIKDWNSFFLSYNICTLDQPAELQRKTLLAFYARHKTLDFPPGVQSSTALDSPDAVITVVLDPSAPDATADEAAKEATARMLPTIRCLQQAGG